MFDRNEVIPASADTQARRPYPEFTLACRTIGNVAEAEYNSLSAKLTRRMSNGFVGAHRLYVLEVHRQRQRHPHAQRRRAVPAEQQLRGG